MSYANDREREGPFLETIKKIALVIILMQLNSLRLKTRKIGGS
jgi:hypothetical protein